MLTLWTRPIGTSKWSQCMNDRHTYASMQPVEAYKLMMKLIEYNLAWEYELRGE